jgi:uncharacterized membrane protein YagU involved in acid resistance
MKCADDLWRNTAYGLLVILLMHIQCLNTMSLAHSIYFQELSSVSPIGANL